MNRNLADDVWCLTCECEHVPTIPQVTWRCADCGFGQWADSVAEIHAAIYSDHVVYPAHHQTVLTVDDDPLLPPGEVARLFRVDPKTVTRWAAAGRIPSILTPGGHRRFRESHVREALTRSGRILVRP